MYGAGSPQKKDNKGNSFFQADRHQIFDGKVQQEVYCKRFICQFTNLKDAVTENRGRGELCLQNTQTTGVGNSGNEFRLGHVRAHGR